MDVNVKKLMMKNILILGIICIAAVLAFASLSFTSTEINLDQIIENKDCKALQQWENNQLFDDNLNLSSEQITSLLKLDGECELKIIKNLFDIEIVEENKEYDIQITLDKHEYKRGEIMNVEVSITPEHNKGIYLKFDNKSSHMSSIRYNNEDGKYEGTINMKNMDIGNHIIGIHKESSPTGYWGEPIEFEIVK